MKISLKWTILFLITGGYVFFFAGLWYSNLFRWFFDQKLSQELVALLYVNQNRFVNNILSSPRAVTIEEVDTMKNFLKDSRIINALMIDKHGRIRWAADTSFFGKRIEELEQTQPPPTKAILRAYVTKTPKVIAFRREDKDYYEVAVPLMSHGDIKGVVSLEVSREESKATLAAGMMKFYMGGGVVVAIFLVTGVLFLQKVVTGRIAEMKDIVENLSLAQPAWPQSQFKPDELGDLAKGFATFLDRLRATFSRLEKDRMQLGDLEKARWEQILKVLIRTGGVIVLDSDNYCLATHHMDEMIKKSSASAAKRAAAAPGIPGSLMSPAVEGQVASASTRIHLLDFMTSTELLQLINRALERPGHFLEENVVLDDLPYAARVMTLMGSQPQETRTVVWLDPRKA